jgi:hypothetical protein
MIPEIEKAFSETSKIVLGTELHGLEDYGPWLGRNVALPYPAKSAVSGKEVWVPPPLLFLKRKFNKSHIISAEEFEKVNRSPFSARDLEDLDVKEILQKIVKPLLFYCGNWRFSTFANVDKASGTGSSINVYYCDEAYHNVKNIAYSNYVLFFCDNIFGSHGVQYSKFCIHAYNSLKVTRCFEIDGCESSSDLLFCHNSENLQNCMFCFNAKSMRYAVGNVEIGREKYMELRKLVLGRIGKELKEKKQLGIDIYNIGCISKGAGRK